MTRRNPVRVPAEEQAKAVLGAILAGLTAAGTAAAESGIAAAEWIGIAVAVVGTYATVFGVRNAPRGRRRRDEGGWVTGAAPFDPITVTGSRDRTLAGKARIRARRLLRRNEAGCVNLSPLLQALLIILVVLAILALGREVFGA